MEEQSQAEGDMTLFSTKHFLKTDPPSTTVAAAL